MPNFVIGRTTAQAAVTLQMDIVLNDSLGAVVPSASVTVVDSSGGSITVTLGLLGTLTRLVTLAPGPVTATATAVGYSNGPWFSTGNIIGPAPYILTFSSWSPVPIKTSSTTSRKDFGIFQVGVAAGTRDKTKWPYLETSIWNQWIGAGATYVPSNFPFASRDGFITRFIEEEELTFVDSSAPLCSIDYSSVGWSGGNRCVPAGSSGGFPFTARMPSNYVIPNGGGNNCAAHLDGDAITQHQPLTRCVAGANGTSFSKFANQNIKTSDGISGAHGGSNLSALGGTIRYGEFTNASLNGLTYFSHALKFNLQAKYAYYWGGGGGNQFRWPASTADGYASAITYAGTNSNLKPGALLALLPSASGLTMLTAPGNIIRNTMIRFGGYCVDDSAWNAVGMAIEKGPAGNVADEFQSLYSLPFRQEPDVPFDKTNWYKDMETIFANLQVVSNNAAISIGGGGSNTIGVLSCPTAFGN